MRQAMTNTVDRRAWLWFLIGAALLPFVSLLTVIPGAPWGPALVAWIAPVFLLRFTRTSARARVALPLIFVAQLLAVYIANRFLSPPTDPWLFALALVAVPLVRSLCYTLPFAADRALASRVGAWPRLFVFPLAATTVDWVMSLSRPISSAGSIAYTQIDALVLVQLVSLTGLWGLTFLIAWFAATANALWESNFDWRQVRAQVGLFAGVLIVVVAFGTVRLAFAPPATSPVPAASVTIDSAVAARAAAGIDWARFGQSTDQQRAAARPQFQATVDQMLARTEAALRGGARVVGWQEGSALVLEEDKQGALDRASALAREYGGYIQVALQVFSRVSGLAYMRNQSILIDDTGAVRWTYDKTYPAWFNGEAFLTIAGNGVLPVVDTPLGRLSTAICNDMYFAPLLRQAGSKGVDILFAPTHAVAEASDVVAARYRSVEEGFSLVRPAGNGTSLITDPQGRVLSSQEYQARGGIMLSAVPFRGISTVYSKIGDTFAHAAVIALAVIGLVAGRRRERRMPAVPSPVRA
jgi:apolipoprotein N-acyltransferase